MMRYKRWLEFDLVANFSLNFLIFIKIIPNLLDIKLNLYYISIDFSRVSKILKI